MGSMSMTSQQREIAWSLSRARPAEGDDLVSVVGSGSEAAVRDDEVLLRPGHESGEPFEELLECEDEMGRALTL
jgi:hypothetical protein